MLEMIIMTVKLPQTGKNLNTFGNSPAYLYLCGEKKGIYADKY